MSHQQYQNCIEACYACAIACTHCATECLKEEKVRDLRRCIQLDMECASICKSSADLMSLGSSFSSHFCADVCNSCAEECEKHAQMGMRHCGECAAACRKCAKACEEMAVAA